MEILKMKNMGKLGIMGIVFCTVEACLSGATYFSLPAGTPGRQEIIGTEEPDLVAVDRKVCEHIIVPYTTCDLFFPIDGSQPESYNAWDWSGAGYVGQDNDEAVTDWWITTRPRPITRCPRASPMKRSWRIPPSTVSTGSSARSWRSIPRRA